MDKLVRERFCKEIKNKFETTNYRFVKSSLTLKLGNPVYNEIYFRTNSNSDGCGFFEPQFYVYNDEYSKIKSQLNAYYAFVFKSRKPVIGAAVIEICKRYNLERLNWISVYDSNENLKHMICNEKDMKNYLSCFSNFMKDVGFEFLNSFQTDEGFDKWFNLPFYENDYQFRQHGDLESMPIWGLISARLSNNPDYESIYSFWMNKELPSFATKVNGVEYNIDIRKEMEMLKKLLENYPANY